MSNEMVERGAKAICAVVGSSSRLCPTPCLRCLQYAHAAINAIEPELQILLGALADIGGSNDMDEQTRRNKANRIYAEMRKTFDEAMK